MSALSSTLTSAPTGPPAQNGSDQSRIPSAPKNVAFELLIQQLPQYRARLPMRVQIYPHDTTESIVTTVKNFYGLYSGPAGSKGVSFEDEGGVTLIARYENFRNNMVVYVRVNEDSSTTPTAADGTHSCATDTLAGTSEIQPLLQAQVPLNHVTSRPNSRTSRKRSPSLHSCSHRSISANNSSFKARPRAGKNHVGNLLCSEACNDGANGYSSGDNAPGSVTSGKAKEQFGNTEISVDNILEGGRRKRAKFESSELPLFAPPQMPANTSNPSISPARRVDSFNRPPLNLFHHGRSLQSPPMHATGYSVGPILGNPAQDARRQLGLFGINGLCAATAIGGIPPTPDPTVHSCVSDEDKDVAIQLMRLGEISNFSHGRTSASTLDDTFSGYADAASSTGATSDVASENEDEKHLAHCRAFDTSRSCSVGFNAVQDQYVDPAGVPPDDGGKGCLKLSANLNCDDVSKLSKSKPVKASRPALSLSSLSSKESKVSKTTRPSGSIKSKKLAQLVTCGPMSPPPVPIQRKTSISVASVNPSTGEEELDLSSKPRCQRCRKSKKGCDRQRPCGRCKDAGIADDQCVSEDENNGRKGRFGRHMGVSIKKDEALELYATPGLLPGTPLGTDHAPSSFSSTADKSKKRKR